MCLRLLLAVSVALAMAASVAFSTVPAHARAGDQTCVLSERGARLYPIYAEPRCGGCCCRPLAWRWVRSGRAFRVEGHHGPYLLVWHREAKGWIDYRHLRIAHEAFCRAAGM